MTLVLKFGGSSITKEGFKKMSQQLYRSNNVIIVLSAYYGVTNLLLKLINTRDIKYLEEIIAKHHNFIDDIGLDRLIINDIIFNIRKNLKQNNQTSNSYILGCGEYLSTLIFHNYLKDNGIKSYLADTSKFIRSIKNSTEIKDLYTSGEIKCDINYLRGALVFNRIIVTPGFVISSKDKKRFVMSRGGSDTTASIIASTILAERLEIWTDVDGMYNGHPGIVDDCQIIENLDYDLCQEMSAMGAQVIHPYCIKPCQLHNIPIYIKNTYSDNKKNTIITKTDDTELSLIIQKNNIVFEISSISMWNGYGFVSHIFEVFAKYGVDINIINTSQFEVSVTSDNYNSSIINKLTEELSKSYKIKIFDNCDIISAICRNVSQNNKINNIAEYAINNNNNILMTHHSSNKMCISYVVPNNKSINFYKELHNLLFENIRKTDKVDTAIDLKEKWWYDKIFKIESVFDTSCKDDYYVYDLDTIVDKCNTMTDNLSNVSKFFYAMKANHNNSVLSTIQNNNFNFECVSLAEVYVINKSYPDAEILFTPNYCSINEYELALKLGCNVVVDNYEVIHNNISIFENRKIGLRLDLNLGDGHHKKVITEGYESKFGIPLSDISCIIELCQSFNIEIVGLHSHRGSGISKIDNWVKTLRKLHMIANRFDKVKWLDIGGGFGTKLTKNDFILLNHEIGKYNKKNYQVWIEPGRYIVSDAGVLVSKVNLVRSKGKKNFIGLSTGMNTLMRPTLYSAYHDIWNLSKINYEKNTIYDIVGPICESGDILGKNRMMPHSETNDIILIENCGAYGKTMSNNYNLRIPSPEYCLPLSKINRIKIRQTIRKYQNVQL